MDRDRLQRRLGGGRAKKTAKKAVHTSNNILDGLDYLLHHSLLFRLEVTVTFKVTVTFAHKPDLNKNFLIHTGTKKLDALRGTTRFVGRDTISLYRFSRYNGPTRR